MRKEYKVKPPKNLPLLSAKEFRAIIEKSHKVFYVYGLCDERGYLFYVGKGSKYNGKTIGIRALVHESDARSNWCQSGPAKYIRKIWRKGGNVRYCCFHNCSHEFHSFLFEQATITRYGLRHEGGLLINKNAGGLKCSIGYKLTIEQKKKLSNSSKLKKLTKEHKNSISLGIKNSIKHKLSLNSPKSIAYRLSIQKPVIIEGTRYQSVREASRNSELSMGGIMKRLKSPNFPEYKYENKGAA